MTRSPDFETRLQQRLQARAALASRDFDAFDIARSAVERRPSRSVVLFGRRLPTLHAVGLVAAISLVALVAGLGTFSGFDRSNGSTAASSATPPVAPSAGPSGSPTPVPLPSVDLMVKGYVTGTWTYYGAAPSQTPAPGHTFINAFALQTNDDRVNGDGTFDAADAFNSITGSTWGTIVITNPGGRWSGACLGATWHDRNTVMLSCELAGSGSYAGLGFYIQMRGGETMPLTVEGVIHEQPNP